MIPEQLPPIVVTLATTAAAIVAAYLGTRSAKGQRAAIQFETKIRDILEDKLGIPSPDTKRISESEIETAVADAIPGNGAGNIEIVTSDGTYLAPTPAEWSVLRVIGSFVERLPYRPERFDCEDIGEAMTVLSAFIAGTNAVGTVYDWEADHAYNVIVTSDGTARFYEPQEDKIITATGGQYSFEGDNYSLSGSGYAMF